MSLSLYLIVEGVTDATLVGKILIRCFDASVVTDPESLPPSVKDWVLSYKWPHNKDISRPSVPIPKLFKLPDNRIVAIANGTGIGQMKTVAATDQMSFNLRRIQLDAVAAIVDADDKLLSQRVALAAEVLTPFSLSNTTLVSGQIVEGAPRYGVLVVPDPPGITIDSILDCLGASIYPELHADAAELVRRWVPRSKDTNSMKKDLKELRAPAGEIKARIGVMGAILKPMKPFTSTLDDHAWVSESTVDHESLRPLRSFIDALLKPAASLVIP